MSGMRRWAVITAAAIVVIPMVDILMRFVAAPGWILVFLFIFGAPAWLASFVILARMARGLFSATSAFATAAKGSRISVLTLLWVYLSGLTIFCWFMPDGGDADDWQSPAGRLLGVDVYGSHTPEYMAYAQSTAVPAFAIAFVALLVASVIYANITSRAATPLHKPE